MGWPSGGPDFGLFCGTARRDTPRGGPSMRTTTFAALSLWALSALAGRADEAEPPADAKAELKKLQGTWTVTKAMMGKREFKAPPGLTYTFDGDRLTQQTPLPKLAGGKGKEDRKRTMTYK